MDAENLKILIFPKTEKCCVVITYRRRRESHLKLFENCRTRRNYAGNLLPYDEKNSNGTDGNNEQLRVHIPGTYVIYDIQARGTKKENRKADPQASISLMFERGRAFYTKFRGTPLGFIMFLLKLSAWFSY